MWRARGRRIAAAAFVFFVPPALLFFGSETLRDTYEESSGTARWILLFAMVAAASFARFLGTIFFAGFLDLAIGDDYFRGETRTLRGVLRDLPCTATGTIRRHPDVARLKRPADVATLTSVQDRLLQAAVAMTRPGGVIVYCACSLQPEEGALRLQALFDADTPAARLPVTAEEVGGVAELITRDGDLRTLPWHLGEQGGMDGFYAARLVRR